MILLKFIFWLFFQNKLIRETLRAFDNRFLDYQYDILIDLSLKNNYVLNYLLKASITKFKTGASKKDITIFDLVINSFEISNLNLLITKITDYLTQVK